MMSSRTGPGSYTQGRDRIPTIDNWLIPIGRRSITLHSDTFRQQQSVSGPLVNHPYHVSAERNARDHIPFVS